jgi:hypothetical protein
MTTATNKAKKRLKRAMDEYVTELRNAEILIREMIQTLSKCIPAGEGHKSLQNSE